MANIRELRTTFTAEAKGIKKAFQQITREARNFGRDLSGSAEDANKEYDRLADSTDKLKRSLQDAGDVDAFSELNDSAEQARREIEQTGEVSVETMARLERAVDGSAAHFDSLGDDARSGFSEVETAIVGVVSDLNRMGSTAGGSFSQLGSAASGARSDLNRVGGEVDELDSDLRNLGSDSGLDDLTEDTEGLGDSLGALGGSGGIIMGVAGALGAAAAGLAGFVAAGAGIFAVVKGGDDLQGTLNDLQVATGSSKEEMDGMKESLVDIYGGNYGESFDDIAAAMGSVSGATKLTDEALESATTQAILLRDSFGWEVDETMRAVRSMMTEFGYSAEEAMTVLAQGQQELGTSIDDTLDTFNEYSGAFADLGFNGEQAMNMITNSVAAGARNTDIAADAVNEFATRIMDGSDTTREALEAAGLDADKIIAKFNKGGPEAAEAFGQVTEAISGIGSASEREQTAVGLFGTIAEDAGVDAVLALGNVEGQANATADTLEEMDSIKYNTVTEAIAGMGRAFTADVLIPLQDKIMPFVNDGVEKFKELAETAKIAFGALKEFLSGDETASDVLMSYGLDPDNFDKIVQYGNLLQENLSKIRDVAGKVFERLRNGFNTLRDNALPILGSIIDTFTNVFNRIMPIVQPILDEVIGFVGGIFKKLIGFWNSDGKQFVEALKNAFDGILTVVEFVMPAVLLVVDMVWTAIKGVISGALDVIMGAVKVFSGLFTGDFKKMWEGVKQLFTGAIEFVWNFIQLTFFGKILSGARVFIGAFRSGFASMWNAVKSLFSGGGQAALTFLKRAWDEMWTATKNVFTNIGNFLKNTWNSIKSITSGAINAVKTIFTTGWNFIRNTTTTVFNGIWNFLKGLFSVIRTGIRTYINFYRNLFTNGWNAISTTTRNVFNAVWTFLRNTFVNIRNFISDTVGGVLRRVRDVWTSLKNSTTNTFRDIFNAIKTRFTDIVNAAKDLPGRIGDGIGSMASKVTSGVTKVINTLARTLGKGVNGVISGINWVLDKIGVKSEIPKWDVPQYAQGTKGAHPGGLMIVGDGKGDNAGPELIKTPDGKQYLSPEKPTLMHGEEGTEVLSAKKTREFLKSTPAYAWGTDVWNGVKNIGSKIGSGIKSVGSKVKDVAIDVFDYIKNPSKLLDLGLKAFGVSRPQDAGFVGDMAKGAYDKVKEGAKGLVKRSLDSFAASAGGPANFGGAFRKTSSYGWRTHPLSGKRTFHNGDDYGAPAGTPIPNQAAGEVVYSGYHNLRGNYVKVRSGNYDRIYQHNSRNLVRTGDVVTKGQHIGTVGSTGASTGPHLHFEVLKNGEPIAPSSLKGVTFGNSGAGGMGGAAVSAASKYLSAIVGDGDYLNDWATHMPKHLIGKTVGLGKKAAQMIDQYGAPARKYFQFITEDDDWMNDWVTHLPEGVRNSVMSVGRGLAQLQGYADGGIVNNPELAWLAEGGFAESIISHDPAKRTSQRAIWEKTGEELGFGAAGTESNKQIVNLLKRIVEASEAGHGHDIIMNDRLVAEALNKAMTRVQNRDKNINRR